MSLRQGSKVWAEDRDLAWVAAEVLGFSGKRFQVVTASGKKVKEQKLVLLVFCFFVCLFVPYCEIVCKFVGIGFSGEVVSERWG
jgi:hypothetical protein